MKTPGITSGSLEVASGELVWEQMRDCVDEEIVRIPKQYRVPLIACYLEGKSVEAEADILHVRREVLRRRLHRGRRLLHRGLIRRGVMLSMGLMSLLLFQNGVRSAPESLISSVVKTVRARVNPPHNLPW
jgi:hypothetical protein